MMSTSASRSSLAAKASPMRRTADCRRLRSRMASCRRLWACSMRARRSRASSMSSPASGRTSRTAARWWHGGEAGEEADRRQAGIDDDARARRPGSAGCGRDAAGGRLAQRRGRRRRTGSRTSSATPSSGRLERSSCGAPAMTSTSAGPRACHASGIAKSSRSAEPRRRTRSVEAREDEAGGHEQRHGGRRQQHEHRHEHELRREDVAGADGELDPRDQRVEHDEHDGESRRRSPTVAPGTSSSATAPSTNSTPATSSVRSSRRSTPRDRASQDSSRSRSAASSLRMSSAVVSCGDRALRRPTARACPGRPVSHPRP